MEKVTPEESPECERIENEDVLKSVPADWQEETDNDGQIIFYTGLYRWKDGSVHDKPEGA